MNTPLNPDVTKVIEVLTEGVSLQAAALATTHPLITPALTNLLKYQQLAQEVIIQLVIADHFSNNENETLTGEQIATILALGAQNSSNKLAALSEEILEQ